MTCFLYILGIIGSILVTCIVVELNERESAAVVYLSREHETDLVSSHFGVKVNDTLNILNGIAVAVAVAKSAVDERCCS